MGASKLLVKVEGAGYIQNLVRIPRHNNKPAIIAIRKRRIRLAIKSLQHIETIAERLKAMIKAEEAAIADLRPKPKKEPPLPSTVGQARLYMAKKRCDEDCECRHCLAAKKLLESPERPWRRGQTWQHTLGLPRTATLDEARAAHKRLCRGAMSISRSTMLDVALREAEEELEG